MLTPVALVALPASAFPPGHKVFTFNFNVATKSRIAKLKQTVTPPTGTFKGGLDVVTGQLNGGMKLPNFTFSAPTGGLGSVTVAMTQVKPVVGKLDLKTNKMTATTTFVIKIVSAYVLGATSAKAAARPPVTLPTLPVTLPTLPVTLPTLPVITLPGTPPPGTSPSVNLVGKNCVTAKAITMTLKGTAKPTAGSTLLGGFTIPSFTSCGSETALFNHLLSGPGNTFTATATPATSTTSLPITLPSLPVTLPTLPITLPTLPVTLPTFRGHAADVADHAADDPGGHAAADHPRPPTILLTLPTLPPTTLPKVTLPTLPITLPTLPHG